MNKNNILKDKTVLVVDDEPDVLDAVEEELKGDGEPRLRTRRVRDIFFIAEILH